MSKALLSVELDKSVQGNNAFKKITSLSIHSFEIFKFAIFNDDPPDYLSDEDVLTFLEGQIPKLEEYNSAYIGLDGKRILSFASEEKAVEISELIGTGVGLKYVTDLFGVNRNTIEKVRHIRTKRLDFSLAGGSIKLETKGTTYENKINSIKRDIFSKKRQDPSNSLKIGTITIIRKKDNIKPSKLIVCDDYVNPEKREISMEQYFSYYLPVFSFILDNYNYNAVVEALKTERLSKNLISKEKIFGMYEYNGRRYLGNFFDKRLVFEKVEQFVKNKRNINALFKILTERVGVTKYFIGLSEEAVNFMNELDINSLRELKDTFTFKEDLKRIFLLDSDGILLIKSDNFSDRQIEKNFSEKEVIKRLRFEKDYHRKKPHSCGAPCRSKGKEGKPCEIRVYRGRCHFHR